jgi:hypothetical protein
LIFNCPTLFFKFDKSIISSKEASLVLQTVATLSRVVESLICTIFSISSSLSKLQFFSQISFTFRFIFDEATFIYLNCSLLFIIISKLIDLDSHDFTNNFLVFHHLTSTFVASKLSSKSASFQVLLNITGDRVILSPTQKKLGKLSFIITFFVVVKVS